MTLPISATFHHVGITVTNLERAIEWYGKVFGLAPGVALEVSGPSGERVLRLPKHIHRAVLLPVGNFAIELLEFEPTRKPMEMRQDDIGYVYICFAVDDLDDVYARLTAAGIDFHTEPLIADEGQLAGSKFCVMRDPDGDHRPKGLSVNIKDVHGKKIAAVKAMMGEAGKAGAAETLAAYRAKITKESSASQFVYDAPSMRAAHEAMAAHVEALETQLEAGGGPCRRVHRARLCAAELPQGGHRLALRLWPVAARPRVQRSRRRCQVLLADAAAPPDLMPPGSRAVTGQRLRSLPLRLA